jgi:hypothetical protein
MRTALLYLFVVAASAHAQLSGSVSTREVRPNEVFTLTLNGEGSDIGTPVLPQTSDFIFMNPDSPQVGKQTNMSFDGRRMHSSTSMSFTYKMRIEKEGTYTLPGISLTIDGKTYTTQPLEVTCSNSAPRRPVRPQRGLFDLMNPRQRPATPREPPVDESIEIEDIGYFDLTTDKAELYVGEPLTVTMRWGQLNIGGVDAGFEIPAVKPIQGFFVEGQQSPLGKLREEIGGREYNMEGWKQTWFPTEPGSFTLDGIEANVHVMRSTRAGIDQRVIVKKSLPIAIKVNPLPPAPPEFSGAIGDIKLTVNLGAKELLQGSAVDLLITINGRGNAAAINAPAIPELAWAHISPPTNVPASELPAGTLKTFKYMLTPLKDGLHEFPSLSINYFSPANGAYATTATEAIPLNVRKAVQTAPVVVGGTVATARGIANIHPILHSAPAIGPQRSGWALNSAAVAVPPALYAVGLVIARRRRRLAEDTGFARDYFARSKSEKRLASVRGAKDPTDALFRALAGFVADKLLIEEAGMTSADARRAISQRGLPLELAEGVEKILRACERARYAGSQLSEAELGALMDAAVQAMDKVEDGLRNGGAE